MHTRRKSLVAMIVLAILIIVVAIAASWLYHQQPRADTATVAQNTVPGMSTYTDADFGFSFWYPSSAHITKRQADPSLGSAREDSTIMNGKGTSIQGVVEALDFTAYEVYSPSMSILSSVDAGPLGSQNDRYYYDAKEAEWMSFSDGGPRGDVGGVSLVDISNETMGGLPTFGGYTRFAEKVIVALSTTRFLAIYSKCNDATDYLCTTNPQRPYSGLSKFLNSVKTIEAVDPKSAVSADETLDWGQVRAIRDEAYSYGIPVHQE